MKIVHLCISNFFIDNYSYQENMLVKYHAQMGHDVTVIASSFSFNSKGEGCFLPTPSEKIDKDGCKIIRLSYKKPVRLFRFLRSYQKLYSTLEYEKPDIIFSHGVAMVDTTILVKYIKRHPNVILFGDHHGDYINSAKNKFSRYILHPIIWRYYVKKLEPYLKKCYGVTPMRCRFLKEMYHLNPQLVEFLPMGVDDEAIPDNRESVRIQVRQELGLSEDDFLIFTGGKIDKLKNTHILLETLRQLGNKRLHLVICGTLTPAMEYLKESFYGNIHYLGWCDASRVMNCMVASDIACFPGTHSTLWEQAVGVGLPCILKHWNEMTHMNVNDNCVFISGEDMQELRDAINKMLQPKFFHKMKLNAESARNSFLYSRIAAKAIDI